MKKIKYLFALCLAALALSSCSNDADVNTKPATVAFAQTSLSVKENKGIFYVPINVEGSQNGPIEVDVDILDGGNGCQKDVHFLVTSTHLIIPEGKTTVNVEILSVDDRVINDDRSFQLRLSKAKGADISATSGLTTVVLLDNDNIPYERLAGTWIVEATNILSESGNEPITWTTTLSTVEDESDPNYGTLVTMSPWAVWDGSTPVLDENGQTISHPLQFHYNEATGAASIDLSFGSIMAKDLMFGTDENGVNLDNATIRSATTGMAGLVYNGTMVGKVSENFDEIKFNLPVFGIIFTSSGSPYQYQLGFDNITLKLKQ